MMTKLQCITLPPGENVVISGETFDALCRYQVEYEKLAPCYERDGIKAFVAEHWPDMVLTEKPDEPPVVTMKGPEGPHCPSCACGLQAESTTIPSPSELCGLLGCKAREPHDHEVLR